MLTSISCYVGWAIHNTCNDSAVKQHEEGGSILHSDPPDEETPAAAISTRQRPPSRPVAVEQCVPRRMDDTAIGQPPWSLSAAKEQQQSDMAQALQPHFASQTPVVLKGAVTSPPSVAGSYDAIHCWSNWDYLRLAVGEDTLCDVEVGATMNSSEEALSGRSTIRFGDYLDYMKLLDTSSMTDLAKDDNDDQHKPPQNLPLVYLAQNDVFEGLKQDFTIPHLCEDSSSRYYGIGNGKLYNVMIWLGPKGTVSPLHYDPMDNLLLQFVGRKRILLFPPSSSDDNYYYAGEDGCQYNTSPIDVEDEEAVDLERYPLFANAPPAMEAMLEPGDVLYIPQKCWHHVRSLDTSISINVWWR
eukprot:scaffold49194_cov66-Attheya_sp.AAC.2